MKYKSKQISCTMGCTRWRCSIFSQLLPLVWHYYPLVVNRDIVFKKSSNACVHYRSGPTLFWLYFLLCKYDKMHIKKKYKSLQHVSPSLTFVTLLRCVTNGMSLSGGHFLCPSQQQTQMIYSIITGTFVCVQRLFFFFYPSDAFAVTIIYDRNNEIDKSEQLLWWDIRGVFN